MKRTKYRPVEGAPPPSVAEKGKRETPRIKGPFPYEKGSKNRTKS